MMKTLLIDQPDKLPMTTAEIMKIVDDVIAKCIKPNKYVQTKANYCAIKDTDCDFQEATKKIQVNYMSLS